MSQLSEPATSRWRGWCVALLIGLPIAALFGPACFTDSSFATRDAGHFYYPLFEWTAREWGASRVPLWNPLEGGGSAVVADASSSVFYPGKLLFALRVSFALRFKLYVVAHLILAAAGAFRLARGLSCSDRASVLAAIAYSCGGSVAFQYSNVVFLVSAAWLPWAFLALLSLMRAPGWAAALWLAMVLALMVLGGDPQMVVHVGFCAVLYFAAQIVGRRSRGDSVAEQATDESRYVPVLVRGGLLGVSLATAFALSAVQILPAREAAAESTRAAYVAPRNVYELAEATFHTSPTDNADEQTAKRPASEIFGSSGAYSHQNDVYDFSIGPWRFAELFWPNVFGRMFPTHRRWLNELPAEGRIWTPTIYLGLLTSVLGLWQLRPRSIDSIQRWLSWVFILFALGSLGWYGLGWLTREVYGSLLGGDSSRIGVAQPVGGIYWFLVTFVPGYVQFRYPAKLFVVASLALSLLAAKGWDQAMRERSRGLIAMLITVALLSLLGILASFMGADWFSGRPWKPDPVFGPLDVSGASWEIRFGFLQTLLVTSLTLFTVRMVHQRRSAVWANALLAAVALDLAVANAWFVATAPSDTWSAKTSLTSHLPHEQSATPQLYRVRASNWWPSEFRTQSSTSRMAQICAWEHETLFPKHHLLANVQLADSSSSLRGLDRDSFWRVARQLRRGGPVPHENALRLSGVQFLLAPSSFMPRDGERWEEVEVPDSLFGEVRLWRVPDPLPDAWIVHRVLRLKPISPPYSPLVTDERMRQVLRDGDQPRDFTRSAIVETDQPVSDFVDAGDSLQPAECRFRRESPQRLAVSAKLDQPGLLVINQAYARGWVARLQSEEGPSELPILRTNRILQGVMLPAGTLSVELSYEPTSFYLGAAISSLAWLTVAILLGIAFVRRRRS